MTMSSDGDDDAGYGVDAETQMGHGRERAVLGQKAGGGCVRGRRGEMWARAWERSGYAHWSSSCTMEVIWHTAVLQQLVGCRAP